ncbi:arylamine N-acetyltransferase family protein [Actinomadura montaniterrae]|uniref:Arylamine N-acetyltransferase n=1 Tax=Actinomadura montaniterrae TaxID=1803903 RepID=A0A6L3VYX4_9ACTN|nr:arylamine N-acetyltransferase [Actinomadura montaniterrae]KAB2386150.1 arylamine N-acetyltransferase [Actinomadura montaniterrae]
MSEDLGYGWQSDLLDLPAYLKRIGYDGAPRPDAATLRALHRAHVTSIPFENLEIMLGRPVELDLAAVQGKLVDRPRGGYCFEHNRLFAAVLEKIGFEVTALTGRVSMGAEKLLPGTHALLLVRTPGQPADEAALLCDVGFGGGPLEPLAFPGDGADVDQDGWGLRLRPGRTTAALPAGAQVWEMHQRGPDGWFRRHSFPLVEAFRVDFDVLNHYVSTSPRSPFTRRPFVQRFSPEAHLVLDGTAVTVTRPAGETETRDVAPARLPEVLAEEFGIVLEGGDPARLVARVDGSNLDV